MSLLKPLRLKHAALIIGIEQLLQMASGFGIAVILARALGPHIYGEVKLFEFIAMLTLYIGGLGMVRTLGRFVPLWRRDGAPRHSAFLGFGAAILVTALGTLLLTLLVIFNTQLAIWYNAPRLFENHLLPLTLFVLFTLLSNLCHGWLQSVERRDLTTIGILSRRALVVAGVLIGYLLGLNITYVLWLLVMSITLELLILGQWSLRTGWQLFKQGSQKPEVASQTLPRLKRYAATMALSNGLVVLRDVAFAGFMLGWLLDSAAVALFSVAVMLPNLLYMFSPNKMLGGILVTRQSTLNEQQQHQHAAHMLKLQQEVFYLIWLPALLGLALTLPFWIPTVFGSAYATAIPVGQVFCFNVGLILLAGPMQYVLILKEHNRTLLSQYALGLLNIPLFILLVPQWGIIGAAISLAILAFTIWLVALSSMRPLNLLAAGLNWPSLKMSLGGVTLILTSFTLSQFFLPSLVSGAIAGTTYLIYIYWKKPFSSNSIGQLHPLLKRLEQPKAV